MSDVNSAFLAFVNGNPAITLFLNKKRYLITNYDSKKSTLILKRIDKKGGAYIGQSKKTIVFAFWLEEQDDGANGMSKKKNKNSQKCLSTVTALLNQLNQSNL